MKAKGTPMKKWDVRINRGILTGYNAAFIIDEATRQRLVDEDANSANIIKPILRGQDIQRYQAQWAGKFLIDTHNGYGDVPAVNIDDYLAVRSHLEGFYRQLERRQDKGRTPYNLRNCAYYEEFAKEKLFWMHMAPVGRFAYSGPNMICNQKAFMVTGNSLKYLCAVLNCRVITWWIKNTAVTTGMGLIQWDKFIVEPLPIPEIPATEQEPFIHLVDRILVAERANPDADTTDLETELDHLVYKLYCLTDEEIAAVEQ